MRLITVFLLLSPFIFCFVSATIPTDCEDSIIAYWRFENKFEDSIGIYDGTGSEGIGFNAEDMIGYSLYLDSNGKKVTVSDSSSLDLNSVFTIEMFAKIDEIQAFDSELIDKTNYIIKYFGEDLGDEHFESAVYDSYNKQWVNISSEVIDIYEKYHLAMTWNGTTLQLYINGVVVGMAPLTDTQGTSSDLVFGEGFYGLIDEIAFYNKALSTNTIRSHYYRGVGKKDYCDASGASGVSSTRADFVILGCSVTDSLGTYGIAAGSCSKNGRWFCESIGNPLYTLSTTGACSIGGGNCCPQGFKCNSTDQCEARTEDCSINTDSTSCKADNCFWLEKDGKGICAERPSDFSCSYYEKEADCKEDVWNLGQEGIGTEVCGSYVVDSDQKMGYIVPQDLCKCEWDLTERKCYFSYEVGEEFFNETQSKFTCLKNYTAGACENGRQHVSWNVTLKDITGTLQGQGLQKKITEVTSCTNGELDRSCGDAVVKMPFFGLYNFIIAAVLIGLIHWALRLR